MGKAQQKSFSAESVFRYTCMDGLSFAKYQYNIFEFCGLRAVLVHRAHVRSVLVVVSVCLKAASMLFELNRVLQFSIA